MAAFESLDYDINENKVYEAVETSKTRRIYKWQSLMRWILALLIGVFTAMIACGVDYGTKSLGALKFAAVDKLMVDNAFVAPFFAFIGISAGFSIIATVLVSFFEPVAAGSGIPEIKSYLNGVRVPRLLRFRTLFCKAIGVMFTVASGLEAGKEGPMIHAGSVVAAGLSQGKMSSITCKNREVDSGFLMYFRNDHEKRDFVAAGAAAGVAAAFGAPIGGVLFSLEEGASHWNQSLTWRTLFTAMMSTFTLNFMLSGIAGQWGTLSQPGLLSFGSFIGQNRGYDVWEVPFFIILGIVGGALGALFNGMNTRLTLFRQKHISRPISRAIEAVCISILTAVIAFSLPFILHTCQPISPHDTQVHRQFFCPAGTYNDMAALYFSTWEQSIFALFHSSGEFSYLSMCVFLVVYFFVACLTYGISVSSGLFVPAILTGAAYGRILGSGLSQLFPDRNVDPGTYALIGAASFLGGVSRMTISITVIVIESTNDIQYALPIILTVMFAKWVGHLFNEGIYDVHVDLKGFPLLQWQPPKVMKMLTARHVMAQDVQTFNEVENVGVLYDTLWPTLHHEHNGFPVVNNGDDANQTMCGLILRSELCILLSHPEIFLDRSRPPDYPTCGIMDYDYDDASPPDEFATDRLSYRQILSNYPHFPSIKEIKLSAEDRKKFIDLTPYMNPCPFVVTGKTSLTRVFRLLRTMGLRHLPVVSPTHSVIGIITRKDLSYEKAAHASKVVASIAEEARRKSIYGSINADETVRVQL
eukprot:TRINITY_DN4286_c0_g1_i1.p1 TRINITY_DN4286_c0_g1~~TRINITY_DN4286_c0_g1_i1.p1  ORF type:complete len:814 (+),score=118.51 TRINITY_DN4286_c0_g1_i1:176-2443(+)